MNRSKITWVVIHTHTMYRLEDLKIGNYDEILYVFQKIKELAIKILLTFFFDNKSKLINL